MTFYGQGVFVEFTSEISVELIQIMGTDGHFAAAANVSHTGSETDLYIQSTPVERITGIITYMLAHRHGCFDDLTEVLTDEGWKFWPQVTGQEKFATVSQDGYLEYQAALQLVRKPSDGFMLSIQTEHVDCVVTADHNMIAARRQYSGEWEYKITPARDLRDAAHRMRMGGVEWVGTNEKQYPMELIGFFIGDGYIGDSDMVEFHLTRPRKIAYLEDICYREGIDLKFGEGDRFYLREPFLKECYNEDREKVIPRQLLDCGPHQLELLLAGLMQSDGSISETGKQTYSTTSLVLVGQIQELALKIGRAAVIGLHPYSSDYKGNRQRYRITIFRDRNMSPKIGWTQEDRWRQVVPIKYTGEIHCVSVPNKSLYVRRNGKPLICSQTPFEHAAITVAVEAPIFVFREWHRHRIASYNEVSARYSQLKPKFWIPRPDRKMVPIKDPGDVCKNLVQPAPKPILGVVTTEVSDSPCGGKLVKVQNGLKKCPLCDAIYWYHHSARPAFEAIAREKYDRFVESSKANATASYAAYEAAMADGVAKEVARSVLPVGIYSSMWCTMNPRAMMNFLSLRTHDASAKFISYPQAEIEEAARVVEDIFRSAWPITWKAWDSNGRIAP
jgi:thymidylate synthase (FAD)